MFVKIKTFHRKKIVAVFALCMAAMLFLIGRLGYLMLLRADYYSEKAQDLHERERSIKAARGKILDCNGKVLADNKTVCTISVIHSQIKEPEKVIDVLTEELGLERDQVKKRVEKNSSIERIKTNVDKQTGDKIREYDLAGVKVDERPWDPPRYEHKSGMIIPRYANTGEDCGSATHGTIRRHHS